MLPQHCTLLVSKFAYRPDERCSHVHPANDVPELSIRNPNQCRQNNMKSTRTARRLNGGIENLSIEPQLGGHPTLQKRRGTLPASAPPTPQLARPKSSDYFTLQVRAISTLPSGPPEPPIQDATPHDGRSSERLEKLLKNLDFVISRRAFARNHRKDYADQRAHTRNAVENFLGAARAVTTHFRASGMDLPEIGDMDFALGQLEQSAGRLDSKERIVTSSEAELYRFEDVLLQNERAFQGGFGRTPRPADQLQSSLGSPHFGSEELGRHSEETQSTDSIASLEALYYNKVAQTDQLRDELLNFEAMHQRQLLRREKKRSRGTTVEPSEATFLQSYSKSREEKIKGFEDSKMELDRLWKQCLDKGYAVEPPKIPPLPDGEALDHSNRLPRGILQRASELNLVSSGAGKAEGDVLLVEERSSDRVFNWLHGMQNSKEGDLVNNFDSSTGVPPFTGPVRPRPAATRQPLDKAESTQPSLFSRHSESLLDSGWLKPRASKLDPWYRFNGQALLRRRSAPDTGAHEHFELESLTRAAHTPESV
jgi:hypothetical protein